MKLFENFPRHWAICGCCDGEGTSSAYLGDFSMDELNEDPDFAEAYFDGAYDRTCPKCKGSGKVKAISYERLTDAQRQELDDYNEMQAEMAAERRMREQGYQF